jgi:hypothetical protein
VTLGSTLFPHSSVNSTLLRPRDTLKEELIHSTAAAGHERGTLLRAP